MLVVDDAPSVAVSTAEILVGAGLDVAVASTVEQAARVMVDRGTRCVILDGSIVDGNEGYVSDQCWGHPAVILMSGLGFHELEAQRRTYGDQIYAYLAKPVAPRKLIEVVEAALAQLHRVT